MTRSSTPPAIPRRDELRQLYDWTKPQIVIPVHGEALHLHEQAKLARAAGIPQVVEIRNGHMLATCAGARRDASKRDAWQALSRWTAGRRRTRRAASPIAGG